METIIGGGAAAEASIKDSSDAEFMADVVEASREAPVVVDFWAPWCGPCRQLGPLIEKVVTAAAGAVKLVKINIDENPQVAQQLGVQSIPMVYAFKDGQAVDGFLGAVPEGQIKEFVKRLVGEAGETSGPSALEQANERLVAGDHAAAAQSFEAALREAPGEAEALGGLARCHLALGAVDDAERLLAAVADEHLDHPEVRSARTALALAREAADAGEVEPLLRALEVDPNDHESRFKLAVAELGRGERERAVETLLELLRRNRGWNDGAARKKLLELFEAFGSADPVTVAGRHRLAAILFS